MYCRVPQDLAWALGTQDASDGRVILLSSGWVDTLLEGQRPGANQVLPRPLPTCSDSILGIL